MRSVLLVLVLLAATACGDGESVETSAPVGQHPGRLAVIDVDGAVAIVDPDGTNRTTLTTGSQAQRWQPTWAPDGRSLAWSETTVDGSDLVIFDGEESVRVPMPALPFYWMWSPDGDRIGALHGVAGGGFELELVDVESATAEVVAAGAPYYFTWSPDGDSILSHVGFATLAVLDESGTRVINTSDAEYQAPVWAETGVFFPEDGALTRRVGPESPPTRLAATPGPVSVVASPDGERLAVQVLGPEADPSIFASFQTLPELPLNQLVVLDSLTGEFVVASRDQAFSYFWSPDGTMLLLLVAGAQEGQLEWRVWHEGATIVSQPFVPGRSLIRDLVPFFDQYAQSWTPWAPDGSAFAFVGGIGTDEGVWVRDLSENDPTRASSGSWVAWSSR